MALTKFTKKVKGIDCTYHIVDVCNKMKRNNLTEVTILHYVDKAARDADIENYIGEIEHVNLIGINSTTKNDTAWAYEQLTANGAQYYGAVNDSI